VGVLFVDLDGFKNINDSHGHTAGDAVLKAVAERLNECTRKIDTVARVGGDEFLVITGEMSSPKNAELIAEKIIKRLVESVYYEGKEIFVGASIGIAIYPDNGSTSEELLKTADDAMYTVKKSGKNNYTLAKP
ncbi:MAG: GGDEF domain-containing protein, partial [Fibrobacterales bacterium]